MLAVAVFLLLIAYYALKVAREPLILLGGGAEVKAYAAAGQSLVVPEGAVVVPGSRAVTAGKGPEWGLSLATPVIVKYRDDRTDTRTELEAWIR